MLPSLVPKHLQENSQARRAPRTPQFNPEPGILFYLPPRQSPAGTENPAKLKVALSPNPPFLPATNDGGGGGHVLGEAAPSAGGGRWAEHLSTPIPSPVALLLKLSTAGAQPGTSAAPRGDGWRRSSSGAKPSGDSALRLDAFFPRSFRARQIPRRLPDRLRPPGAAGLPRPPPLERQGTRPRQPRRRRPLLPRLGRRGEGAVLPGPTAEIAVPPTAPHGQACSGPAARALSEAKVERMAGAAGALSLLGWGGRLGPRRARARALLDAEQQQRAASARPATGRACPGPAIYGAAREAGIGGQSARRKQTARGRK